MKFLTLVALLSVALIQTNCQKTENEIDLKDFKLEQAVAGSDVGCFIALPSPFTAAFYTGFY